MLRLLETVDEGRFVVANQTIAKGTLVHVASPYSVILSQPATLTNCYHCLSKLTTPRSMIQACPAVNTSSASEASVKKAKGVGKNPQKSASYLAMKAQLKQQENLAQKKKSRRQEAELLAVENSSTASASSKAPPSPPTEDDSSTVLCPQCNVAAYCSQRCQQLHQVYHVRSNECTALREVYRHASHRRPEELLFASIVLQLVLRCYAEGYGPHLLRVTAASPTGEQSTTNDDETSTAAADAAPAEEEHKDTAANAREVSQSSTIPADALKLHALRLKHGTETLDSLLVEGSSNLFDESTTFEIRSAVGRHSTSLELDERAASVTSTAWEKVTWRDTAKLVTNVSLMTRECVSEFNTLHRFFLSVVSKMPKRYFPGIELPEGALYVERHAAVVSENMFHALCSALQCNGFGVHDAADRSIAIGLYPSASYWNHDCNPNLARVMVGRSAMFFALRDIAEAEPLTISYADVEASCSERRYRMLVTYRFYCQCARCAASTVLSCRRCLECAARGYMRQLVQEETESVREECTVCRKLANVPTA